MISFRFFIHSDDNLELWRSEKIINSSLIFSWKAFFLILYYTFFRSKVFALDLRLVSAEIDRVRNVVIRKKCLHVKLFNFWYQSDSTEVEFSN